MRTLHFMAMSVLLLTAADIQAQQDGGGDLRKEEIEIKRDYVPSLMEPVRLENQPAIVDTTSTRLPVTYDLMQVRIPVTYVIDTIQAARIKREPVERIYRNYLKGGFGMYTTPLFQFRHGSGRNGDGRYGLSLEHLSSSGTIPGTGHSAFSENHAAVFGERFFEDYTLYGRFNYNRQVVHRYGFDPELYNFEQEDLRQRFNRFGVITELKSSHTDSARSRFHAGLSFFNIGDLDQTFESDFRLEGSYYRPLDSELFGGDLQTDLYRNTGLNDSTTYGIIQANPQVSSRGSRWYVRAGMKIFFTLETDQVSKAHFYPDAEFHFNVIDHIIIPFAGVGGGISRNSYFETTQINPFVSSWLPLLNTNNKWNVFGGIRGSLSKNISFITRFSYGRYEDMPFFIPSATFAAQHVYTAVYDTVDLLNVHAEAGYNLSEKLQVSASADFYRYSMTSLVHPWHSPEFSLAATVRYSLFKKIIARAELFYLGERYGTSIPADQGGASVVQELGPVTDINLGLEYRYTRRLSGFLQFNNLTASRYYRWTNYPSQRFHILGGVTLAF